MAVARCSPAEALAATHLPQLPHRGQPAKAMFVRTSSLEDIVDRAYNRMFVSIGRQLAVA